MSRGFGLRKLHVSHVMNEILEEEEKETAKKLYSLLDKIELLTMAPFFFAFFVVFVLIIACSPVVEHIPTNNQAFFTGLFGALIFYTFGVVSLKLLLFDRLRQIVIDKLKNLKKS